MAFRAVNLSSTECVFSISLSECAPIKEWSNRYQEWSYILPTNTKPMASILPIEEAISVARTLPGFMEQAQGTLPPCIGKASIELNPASQTFSMPYMGRKYTNVRENERRQQNHNDNIYHWVRQSNNKFLLWVVRN